MTCRRHLWLPERGIVFRYIVCPHCDERRRVRLKWINPPTTISGALAEAVDRGVVPGPEVYWGGQPFS